jgi:glucose-6-phosphate dehydrogenase assembly protein OpcA
MSPRLDGGAAIDVAEVEGRLAELWRKAAGERRGLARTCMLNLIVVCPDGADGMRIGELLRCIARTAPSRAIVIAPGERRSARAASAGLRARVFTHCDGVEKDTRICSEQILLEVPRDGAALVPPTVLQLLVQELPVATWWRRHVLSGDPLLVPLSGLSQRLIVDSAGFPDPAAALRELCEATPAGSPGAWHAADLTWIRQEPWREAIASLFDPDAPRPSMEHIREVRIEAGGPATRDALTAAGAYLAAWLASRLGWRAGDVQVRFEHDEARAPGELGRVELVCAGTEGEDRLTVERERQGARLVLSARGSPGLGLPRRLRLPERDEGALLCGMLQRPSSDALYEAALRLAAGMAAG